MTATTPDEDAYRRLVEPHRRELHAHCYRMLGSVHDADDALQDALLRAWRGLGRFEGRSAPRTWLYRIATNACLDAIAGRPRRALPMDFGPAADPSAGDAAPLTETVWVEPYPDAYLGPAHAVTPEARYDQRESVELAFVAALQHLPANQRAVLILREVLGFSASEAAELLDTTVASVNSALQRARKAVDERLPDDQTQQATLRALDDERLRAVVEAYVDAWERGDVGAVVEMLTDDVTFSMPPLQAWFRGPAAVADFLPRGPLSARRRFVPIGASAQVAFGTYIWEDETGGFRPNAIHVLRLRGDRICEMTAFLDRDVFRAFGLPEHLPADG